MEDIKGFEGVYAITNDGRVWSYRTNKFLKLRGSGMKHGKKREYKTIALFNASQKYEYFYIHRLVASHFIENPRGVKTVNHKDGNKENNTVDNLEWLSLEENIHHAFVNGFTTRGERNSSTKLTEDQVREIRKINRKDISKQKEIAARYNITQSNVYSILIGRSWKWLT